MTPRQIGNSPISVPPLAFGGNVFGWTVNEAAAFPLLDAFIDASFTMIDTADSYSRWVPGNKGGESETIIGKWLKQSGRRAKVVIATKVGSEIAPGRKGLSKKYILQSVEDSLKRLQTDYIDLYQSHRDDPNTPPEETLEAYAELIKSGKVRVIGASNFTGARIMQSLDASKKAGIPRYECLQPMYNLYDREGYEKEYAGIVKEQRIGVIPYYSLAAGFLTGKYRSEKDLSQSPRGEGVKKYLNDRGFRILAALDTVAKEHNCTPAEAALAWLMAQPGITAPIASATSLTQLSSLMKSANLTLSSVSLHLLDEASA